MVPSSPAVALNVLQTFYAFVCRSCSCLLSVAVIDTMRKRNSGRERLIPYSGLHSNIEGIKDRHQQLEEKQRKAVDRLTLRLTFSYLSYKIHVHRPRDGTTHNGLGPLITVSYQENDPLTCLQAIYQGQFFNGSSLFPS